MVMGVLNLTPDSFSDGGELFRNGRVDRDSVLRRAGEMVAAGAAILDLGGESTRPGSVCPSTQEEMDRVLPAVDWLQAEFKVFLSIDTSSPELMSAATARRAHLINDVRALTLPGAIQAVKDSDTAICLMHMRGTPSTMQDNPQYQDVVAEVNQFLMQRVQVCLEAGIEAERLILDPGFGFGKTLQHNLELLHHLDRLVALGYPVMAGLSRKNMIGQLTGKPLAERAYGSIAAAQIALDRGAMIVRVHDLEGTCDMIRVWSAIHQLMIDDG